MKKERRPPKDIDPETFFLEWLPSEIERLGNAANIPDMVVRVEIQGEKGGKWDMVTTKGRVVISPSQPTASPLVRLSLTEEDWRAIAVGEEGGETLLPPSASPVDLLFVDRSSQQLLTTITGTFCFEVEHYRGRTWKLFATFGQGQAPKPPIAVIRTDAETYQAILARKLGAPEAYFTGKVKIEGDAGRGMQVGIALLPKF